MKKLRFFSFARFIPIPRNKFIFQLRESCRQIADWKWHSIKSIQCHFQSAIFDALTRLNMNLFLEIGITPRSSLCLNLSGTKKSLFSRRYRVIPLVFLAGCMVGPNYQRPEICIPDAWVGDNASTPEESISLKAWWEVFQEPLLNRYIAKAEECNYSLQVAEANILRARALKQIAASELFPHVSTDVNGTKTYFSKNGPVFALGPQNLSGSPSSPTTGLPFSLQIPQIQNLFNALFDASWELDLFGKTRRTVESAEALVETSIEEKNDILLSIDAEIARNFIELRSFQTIQTLLQRDVLVFEEIAAITQMQFEAGYVSAFDVEKSLADIQTAKAMIPDVVAEIYRNIFALSVLIGELPENIVDELLVTTSPLKIPKDIAVGLRSDLLRSRPDVRKAERELAAATASVGIAVASFFPSVNLLGFGGFQALQLPELLQWGSRTWGYGTDIKMPVYQGGRLVGNLHFTQALQAAAAAKYQQVVLSAIENAQSALLFFLQGEKTAEHRYGAVFHTEEMYTIEEGRFSYGLSNKLSLLKMEHELLMSKRQAVDSDLVLLISAVALYKSLGGGVEERMSN